MFPSYLPGVTYRHIEGKLVRRSGLYFDAWVLELQGTKNDISEIKGLGGKLDARETGKGGRSLGWKILDAVCEFFWKGVNWHPILTSTLHCMYVGFKLYNLRRVGQEPT